MEGALVDVLFGIMALVDLPTLVSMRLVCRQFSIIASHPTVWIDRLRALDSLFAPSSLHVGLGGPSTYSQFVCYSHIERYAMVERYLRWVSGTAPTHRTDNFKIEADGPWDTTNDTAGEVARHFLKVGDHLCALRDGALVHAIVTTRTRDTIGADAMGRPFTWELEVLYMAPGGFQEKGLSKWLDGSVKAWRLVSTPTLHQDRQAFEQRISSIRDKIMKEPSDPTEQQEEPISADISGLSFVVFCTTGILEQDDVLMQCLPSDIDCINSVGTTATIAPAI